MGKNAAAARASRGQDAGRKEIAMRRCVAQVFPSSRDDATPLLV